MKKRTGTRFGAGQLELKGGTGGITEMCSCGEFLEVYKIDTTFRIHTPESLDPEVTNPNMMWVAQQVADVGSGNPVVARVLLQSDRLLRSAMLPPHIEKESIIIRLRECKDLLLNCDEVAEEIRGEVETIVTQLETEDIPRDNDGRALNPFPQVRKLEDRASTFLFSSKRLLQLLAEVFNCFFATEFHGPHFHKIKRWLADNVGEDSSLFEFIDKQEPKVKFIVDLRNGQEHPTRESRTIIDNFRLMPDHSIRSPGWHISSKPMGPIVEDMQEMCAFLLRFTEVFLILCIFQCREGQIPIS